MRTAERFAQNLKNLRKHAGKTQQEIADILCIKRGTYSSYENGDSEPNMEMLVTISGLYRMSLDTLLRREITLASKLDTIHHEGSRLMVAMQVH